MVIWMVHPNHGRYPAVGDEIDRLKSNGWSVCLPKANAEPVQASTSEIPVVQVVQSTPQDVKRRPGRPSLKK